MANPSSSPWAKVPDDTLPPFALMPNAAQLEGVQPGTGPLAKPDQPAQPVAPGNPVVPAATPVPKVASPLMQDISQDQSALQKVRMAKARPWGFEGAGPGENPDFPQGLAPNHPGKMGKLAHTISAIAQAAGSIFAPSLALVPGTHLNQQMQENQLAKRVNEEQAQQAQVEHLGAETGEAQARTEQTKLLTEKTRAAMKAMQGGGGFEIAIAGLGTLTKDEQATLDAGRQMAAMSGDPTHLAAAIGHITTSRATVAHQPGREPIGDKRDQLNQLITARYQVQHPGEAPPAPYLLPDNAESKDFDRIDKMLEAGEKATATKAQLEQANQFKQAMLTIAQQKGNERPWEYANNQLSTLGKPISDLNTRMGRLKDTIAQGTPQADALVAPELLTIMAGGQGSGLRMNEAEIARIVSGRSNWENLRAAMQKWSLDPSTANSITPEQRQQVRALIQAVDSKLQQKQSILNDAANQLVDISDPKQQHHILAETRQKLQGADIGTQGGGAGPKVGEVKQFPNGKIGKWDGKGWVAQ